MLLRQYTRHIVCGLLLLQEDEALQALRLVTAGLSTAKLRHLNLSDNALGEKGVRAAAAALQHPVSGVHLTASDASFEELQCHMSCHCVCKVQPVNDLRSCMMDTEHCSLWVASYVWSCRVWSSCPFRMLAAQFMPARPWRSYSLLTASLLACTCSTT
eukprot:GHUV01051061.1.p1 GENE.GHUV01051061.1~~GHUV01051061.1.p1  ORF type:complete len:158 (-),score=34.71 GHUV01051061.1:12-485(-)